jgi:hypothetical protein
MFGEAEAGRRSSRERLLLPWHRIACCADQVWNGRRCVYAATGTVEVVSEGLNIAVRFRQPPSHGPQTRSCGAAVSGSDASSQQSLRVSGIPSQGTRSASGRMAVDRASMERRHG